MGHAATFDHLYKLVEQVTDPKSIRYLAFSHLEADESGATQQWLNAAPRAEVIAGKIAISSVRDFVKDRWRQLSDMESLCLGSRTLTLVETPHVPHNWDACLFHLSGEGILFGSDLATQFGDRDPFATQDILDEIFCLQERVGYMTYGPHLCFALKKIRKLQVKILAGMHGSALREDQAKQFFARLDENNRRAMSKV